jgi:hypothetical protein
MALESRKNQSSSGQLPASGCDRVQLLASSCQRLMPSQPWPPHRWTTRVCSTTFLLPCLKDLPGCCLATQTLFELLLWDVPQRNTTVRNGFFQLPGPFPHRLCLCMPVCCTARLTGGSDYPSCQHLPLDTHPRHPTWAGPSRIVRAQVLALFSSLLCQCVLIVQSVSLWYFHSCMQWTGQIYAYSLLPSLALLSRFHYSVFYMPIKHFDHIQPPSPSFHLLPASGPQFPHFTLISFKPLFLTEFS